ncbi:MAG: YbaB/EbfC family nucleoid-associated protein [Ignavibacteria bacterium]|nr:YbaB/EbfC family nucleoid-associated protein [Ignavibacteria bacterium]
MKIDIKEAMEFFQRIQGEIERIKQENLNKIYEGQSGAGLVIAKVNGNLELVSLEISNQAFELNDKSLLEDLIIGAINVALERAKTEGTSELQKFLGPFASATGLNFNF